MSNMTDIVYSFEGKIYLNITNKCPCRCAFCIRGNKDALGSAKNLWFDFDPSFEQIKAAIDDFEGFKDYDKEVVFCGYGEPLFALDNLIETAKYIKSKFGLKIRVNTNGLGDLINKKPTAPLLKGLVDSVSISLNAPDSESYQKLVNPSFGEKSFDAMLKFAESCKGNIPAIQFSVVDVIPQEQIEQCKQLAKSCEIPLRVRVYNE